MHIPEAFWVPFLPWEVRDMSEQKEVILEVTDLKAGYNGKQNM